MSFPLAEEDITVLRRIEARLEAHLDLLESTDAPAVVLIEEEVILVRELLRHAENEER